MTLPEVMSLFAYWRKLPPVHELVMRLAVYFQVIEPPAEEQAEVHVTEDDLRQIDAMNAVIAGGR